MYLDPGSSFAIGDPPADRSPEMETAYADGAQCGGENEFLISKDFLAPDPAHIEHRYALGHYSSIP